MIGELTMTEQIDRLHGDNVRIEEWIETKGEIDRGEERIREPVGEITIETEIHKHDLPGSDHDLLVDAHVPQQEDLGQDQDHHLEEEPEPHRGIM